MKRKELTKRELDVMKCIINGMSNKQIAEELIISIHTVKAMIESIYFKLNVHSRVQAAIKVINEGIFIYDEKTEEFINTKSQITNIKKIK